MKLALITTTINIPSVLALYRRFDLSAAVRFFVAIDDKTPRSVPVFLDSLGNCQVVDQTDYKCDAIIGRNSIQRRNLALLEALKWGADIIVSVDDDNIPIDPNYFHQFEAVFNPRRWDHTLIGRNWSGLCAHSVNGWFDPGAFLVPPATHRGFPAHIVPETYFEAITNAKIGVAAGMVLGDPDISAVERLARGTRVSGVGEILKAGIVVDPQTHTVFNSQNTAFLRQFAPAMMMWPGVSRYDDIMASLVTQRVMREHGYHVHFGRPLVYQQRNAHDLRQDLAGEVWGMQYADKIAVLLDDIDVRGSVIDGVRNIFLQLGKYDFIPSIVSECGAAWCDDVEGVL
jgi:hypothetical protein